MYPPVQHEDKQERKQAILAIFKELAPANRPRSHITSGTNLQGPIKLSSDVGDETNVDLRQHFVQLNSEVYVIEDDDDELKVGVNPNHTMIEQIRATPPPTWEPIMKLLDDNIYNISTILDAPDAQRYLPFTHNVFEAFWKTKFNNIKVIILGMDPYHQITNGIPDACGLSFSYRRDFPVPPRSSLNNIFREIKQNNYPDFVQPNHGDLSSWCEQGVLLLNSSLTVLPNTPGSHLNLWMSFTKLLLKYIVESVGPVIIIAWGKPAQKLISKSEIKLVNWDTENSTAVKCANTTSVVLESAHPSGQSVRGFYGGQHFLKTNMILRIQGKTPIDWSVK